MKKTKPDPAVMQRWREYAEKIHPHLMEIHIEAVKAEMPFIAVVQYAPGEHALIRHLAGSMKSVLYRIVDEAEDANE